MTAILRTDGRQSLEKFSRFLLVVGFFIGEKFRISIKITLFFYLVVI